MWTANKGIFQGILIFTGDNGLKLYLCDLHKLIFCAIALILVSEIGPSP